MIGIRPVANAPACQPIDQTSENSCLSKVWNAVVEFFTKVALYISNAINSVWTSVKAVIYPDAASAATMSPEILPQYRNMPCESVGFVDKSIQLYKDVLRRKEEANIAALPPGSAVPDEQRPLKAFNDEWEMMMNVVDIAKATVRGYVFSDCNATARNIPFFDQVVGQRQGEYDPPVRNPENGELLHNGGHVMHDVHEDRTDGLRALRATFNGLDAREKEIVLDKTDFEGINQMAVSDNAKRVMNGIAETSNLLHQHNARFMAALQAVHGRTFPG